MQSLSEMVLWVGIKYIKIITSNRSTVSVKNIETKSQKNWDKKSKKLRLKVKKIETYKKEILKINDF